MRKTRSPAQCVLNWHVIISCAVLIVIRSMQQTNAFDLAVSSSGGCVTTEALELLCWGVNEKELLGRKDTIIFEPTEVFSGVVASKVALGSNHLCIVGENDDGIFCKGDNSVGQCGANLFISPIVDFSNTTLAGPIKQLAAGKKSTCAIMDSSDNQSTISGNNLFCWGQVLPGFDGLFKPTLMSSERAVYVAVSDHKAAVFSDGTVGTFHLNDAFQLGIGPTTEPVLSLNASNTTTLGLWGAKITTCTGRKHTCVLSLDGRVACAGANNRGQLGLGDRLSRSSFVYIDEKKEVAQLACSGDFTCYVLSDGKVKCFGANSFGQLGLGDQKDRLVPTIVSAFQKEKVSKIVLGDFTSFAVMRDASVRVWGRNDKAQLGLGRKVFFGDNVTSPVFHDSLTIASRNSAPFPVGLQLFLTLFFITIVVILIVAFKEFWLGAYIRSKSSELRQKDRKIFKLENRGLYYQEAEESNSSLDKRRALVIEQLMPCIEQFEQISRAISSNEATNVFHVATLCALCNLSCPGLYSSEIDSLERAVKYLLSAKYSLMEDQNELSFRKYLLEALSEPTIQDLPWDFNQKVEARSDPTKTPLDETMSRIDYNQVQDSVSGWEYQLNLLHPTGKTQVVEPNLMTKLKWRAQSLVPLFPPIKPVLQKPRTTQANLNRRLIIARNPSSEAQTPRLPLLDNQQPVSPASDGALLSPASTVAEQSVLSNESENGSNGNGQTIGASAQVKYLRSDEGSKNPDPEDELDEAEHSEDEDVEKGLDLPDSEIHKQNPSKGEKRDQDSALQGTTGIENQPPEKQQPNGNVAGEPQTEEPRSLLLQLGSPTHTLDFHKSVESNARGGANRASQNYTISAERNLTTDILNFGKMLWKWARNNCLFKPFIDGLIAIFVRVTEYPVFYLVFVVFVLAIFLTFATAKATEIRSAGIDADRPGGFGVTFLGFPPQYDRNRPLQAQFVPIIYGVMHCNLFFLGLLPLPMMRGAIRALVQRKSFLCKLIPLDDAVFLHRFFAYCLLGGLIIGCALWLYTMGFECVDNEQARACLAFDLSNLNPKDNVLMLRVIVWITWFLILPLLYFVRRGPWSFLPRYIKQYHFELAYFSHLIVAYGTLLLALIARFEVFYPVLISWAVYFIGMIVDFIMNFHIFEISLGTEICKDARGTPTSIRLELFKRQPFFSIAKARRAKFEAGQWIYLYVVDEKRWWIPVFAHPFSIAYAPAKRKTTKTRTVAAKLGPVSFPNLIPSPASKKPESDAATNVASDQPIPSVADASARAIDLPHDDELELHIGVIGHRKLKKNANNMWVLPKEEPRPWTDMLRDIMPEVTDNTKWRQYRGAKEDENPSRDTNKKVYVLGPYGTAFASCFDSSNDVSVVIGAGTGLTAAESVLRRFAEEKRLQNNQGTLPRMLWFVWSASSTEDLKWCWNTLFRALVSIINTEAKNKRDPREWVSSSSNQLSWLGLTFYLTKIETMSQIGEFKEEMMAKVRRYKDEKMRKIGEWVTNFMINQIHAGSLVDEETHVKHLLKAIYTKASLPGSKAPAKMAVAYCGAPDLATAIIRAQRDLKENNVAVDIEFSFDSQ